MQKFYAKMGQFLPRFSIILGVFLMVLAISVWGFRYFSSEKIGENAGNILDLVQAQLPPTSKKFPQERGNNQMASRNVNGLNVVGILEFPTYGRSLALLSSWDNDASNFVPCRYSGSIYDRSLVIGASDRAGQLDFANAVETGLKFTLTDMEGGIYTYQVEAIHHAQTLSDSKLQSDYDLTVFVKDSKTDVYLLLRCKAL